MRNTILRNGLLLVLVSVALASATGCKKYEEGPAFSLTSKKARLVGTWEQIGPTSGGQGHKVEAYWEFRKDDTFNSLSSSTYAGVTETYSWSGTWKLSGDKEEIKITSEDGERIILTILRLTNKELVLEFDASGYVSSFVFEYEFEKRS